MAALPSGADLPARPTVDSAFDQPQPQSWVVRVDLLAPLVDPRDREHVEWVSGHRRIIAKVDARNAEEGWNRVGRLRLLFRTAHTASGRRLIRFGVGKPTESGEAGDAKWTVAVSGKLDARAMTSVWPTGRVRVGGDTLDASALFHPADPTTTATPTSEGSRRLR